MRAIDVFLDQLAAFGVRHIFGNPGTTELPLNDALVGDERFRYILGLQEVPVMSMADGFAMASGTLGVVNLHISCGLGNAMGMLYNAYREGTPLLVTAGQQDRRLAFEEPILGGAMVDVARPWTKWAAEVQRGADLPAAIRRAAQAALTPPTGPVFLSLPVDVQLELIEAGQCDLDPPRLPDARVRPPVDALRRAAEVLLSAENPAILVGSRVTERDAAAELVAVAERLGAPAISESGTTHGRLGFPADHPLYAQGLPLWAPEVRERLAQYDVLLVAGMDLLRQYVYYEPWRAIPEHVRLVHLDEDPRQLGKNYPVEVGVVGHTKVALVELDELLDSMMNDAQRASAAERAERHTKSHAAAREKLRQQAQSQMPQRPLTPLALMSSLAEVLPDDVAVIEEAVTTTNTTFERLGALKNTTGYFGHRGWALGWGAGVTIGAKLAWPDRPVLGLLGEGAAMYGVQALWSAAHHRVGVVYVICNNAQYQILKIGGKGLDLPNAKADRFEGLDLVDPEIDFIGLARSLGVEAHRVEEPDELRQRVRDGLAADRPLLLDVPIARRTANRLEYG
ncbi:MAG: thiamine pyrophosphate-binding protein [Pirellulaceae bacterium]